MIPFDFAYYRPNTLAQAYEAFSELQTQDRSPVYYGGGSEIITMCRSGSIQPGAVIDVKKIPDCISLYVDENGLHIGSACTLNQIKESKLFPLLGLACGRIADHTNQCRITLGGNLCGTIIYRETSLPLLLADATITLYGSKGPHTTGFESVFQGRMQLSPGQLITQIHVPKWAMEAKHFHIKQTANEKIDYPLVSIAAIWKDEYLRLAFSGICSYPFRSPEIEAVINDRSLSCNTRVEKAILLLPELPYEDVEGSGEYRMFVLKNMLHAFLEEVAND